MQSGPVGQKAPEATRGEQHHRDGNQAERQQIPRTVIGQRGLQGKEHDDTEDRAFDPANTADNNDEDDIGRPVGDAERRIGRNAGGLDIDQRARQAGDESGDQEHRPFDATGIDAHGFRCLGIVAHSGEGQAEAVA